MSSSRCENIFRQTEEHYFFFSFFDDISQYISLKIQNQYHIESDITKTLQLMKEIFNALVIIIHN